MMVSYKMKNWWILTLKGVFTLGISILALRLPYDSFSYLIRVTGVILIISGFTLVLSSIVRHYLIDRKWNITEGFLDIVIATILLSFQEITPSIFILMIAIWMSFIGILQIVNKYRLQSLFHHWGFLILNGVLAVTFAIFLFRFPSYGMITRIVLIGLQSGILIGFLLVSSYHIKKLLEDIKIDIPHKEGEEGNQELTYY
jgi:uncharacterized membrane protein HdeD (DUF308 family)